MLSPIERDRLMPTEADESRRRERRIANLMEQISKGTLSEDDAMRELDAYDGPRVEPGPQPENPFLQNKLDQSVALPMGGEGRVVEPPAGVEKDPQRMLAVAAPNPAPIPTQQRIGGRRVRDPVAGLRQQASEASGQRAEALEQRQSALSSGADTQARIAEQAEKKYSALAAERRGAERALAGDMQARQAELSQNQERRRQFYEQAERQIADEREAIASTEIDSGLSTGDTVVASLAMALGAMGSAFTGGPNYAMQLVDRAIQRNIDAQKEGLRNRRSALQDRESALSRRMQEFGSEEAAVLVQRGLDREQYADKVEQFAGQMRDTDRQSQAMSLAAELRQQSQVELAEGQRLIAESRLADVNTQAGLLQTGEQIKTSRAQRSAAAASRQASEYAMIQERLGREAMYASMGIAPKPGVSVGEKQLGELRDVVASEKIFDEKLDRLIEIAVENKGSISGPLANVGFLDYLVDGPQEREARSVLEDLKIAYNKKNKLGTLDAGTDRVLSSIFGNNPVTSWRDLSGSLEKIKGRSRSEFTTKLDQYGVKLLPSDKERREDLRGGR